MKRSLLLLFGAAALAFGQSTTKISPDCDIQFSFTASGDSATSGCAQNLQGVRFWSVIYQSDGFSGVSLTMQEAPDNSGAPGTWSTFTAASGTNPATSTTGVGADTTYTGYAPWVRVAASLTGSGTLTGHIYGCKQPGCGSGGTGSGGGGGSTCAGTTSSPCQNQLLPDGTTNPISLSTSGLNRIITGSGSAHTNVGSIVIAFASAVNVQFEYGTTTSTPCDTGTTAISGNFQSITALALDNPFVVPVGEDLCVNLGASVTGGGFVTFKQP